MTTNIDNIWQKIESATVTKSADPVLDTLRAQAGGGWCFATCPLKPGGKVKSGPPTLYKVTKRLDADSLALVADGAVTLITRREIVEGTSYSETGFLLLKPVGRLGVSSFTMDTSGSGVAEFAKDAFTDVPDSRTDPFDLRPEASKIGNADAAIGKLAASLAQWRGKVKKAVQDTEQAQQQLDREREIVGSAPGAIAKLEQRKAALEKRATGHGGDGNRWQQLATDIMQIEKSIQLRKDAIGVAEAKIVELEKVLKQLQKAIPTPSELKAFI